MELKMDHRWSMQKYLNTPEYFEKLANEIEFSDSVPDDIKKYYNRIRSLIKFSYYQYEFVDVAVQLVLISFEMALKIRYREIEGKSTDKKFVKLIEWSLKNKLISIEHSRLDAIRSLRNYSVHLENYGFGGIAMMSLIFSIPKIINDLFVEIDLQRKIIERKEIILNALDFISNKGCILSLLGKRFIVYNFTYIGHYINLNGKIINKLGFIPIFEPKDNLEEISWPNPITIECKGITLEDSKIVLVTGNGDEILVESIDEKNKSKFTEFKSKFSIHNDMFLITYLINYQYFMGK